MKAILEKNLILAGDVNIDLDYFLGTSNVSNSVPNYKFYLQKLVDDLDLVDIWRLKHPQKKRFTRHEKTRYGFAQSQIDFFLISCHLACATISTDILSSIKSDHSLLFLNLSVIEQQKRQGAVENEYKLTTRYKLFVFNKTNNFNSKNRCKKLINRPCMGFHKM